MMKTSTHNGIRSTARKGSVALATSALLAWTGFQPALAQTYTITDLGTLGGTFISVGGLNNFGQVVGTSYTRQSYKLESRVDCKPAPFPSDIECPKSYHCYQYTYDIGRAFLWTPNLANGIKCALTDLGTLGGPNSGPSAINSAGQVAGFANSTKVLTGDWADSCCFYSYEYYENRPFLWTLSQPNGTRGSMTETNPVDFVAAGRTFTGDPTNLNPPGSGWTLTRALLINDSGQIAGYGVNPSGQTHPFLLTPLPAPRLTLAAILLNGPFRFTLEGEAGHSYTIQAFTNLVNWTALTNFVSATGTNQFTDPTAPNFSRRFYRALTP